MRKLREEFERETHKFLNAYDRFADQVLSGAFSYQYHRVMSLFQPRF